MARSTPRLGRLATWLVRLLVLGLLLVLGVGVGLWLALRASLAPLDGERALPGLAAAASLERDARGYLTVSAANRIDVARALGYAHAQERFFQMDLMRRNAAGELSALVGEAALSLDRSRRLHRFRLRAERGVAALPPPQRALLDAYADGVNAGLQALALPPPEYLLLRQRPRPWAAADIALVVFGMYLDLQGEQGRDDVAMGLLHDAVPADWYAFLTQHSAHWQAALDDSRVAPVLLPDTPLPEALRRARLACSDCGLRDARDIGSNNFAVSARHGAGGRALLADDMHLDLRVPGTWFKARMRWRDAAGAHDIAGLTLPGAPALVVGSNGRVAWGFTNTAGDWADVVELRLNAAGSHYLSGGVEKPLTRVTERIEVAGQPPVEQPVLESEWGPLMPQRAAPGRAYALRWVAHDLEGINLRLMDLEDVANVDEAVRVAAGAGVPAQNLMLADSSGRIAWTVIGAMPRRVGGEDIDRPQDWSDGRPRWQGYLGAAEQPRVVDPPDGRLWTANNRTLGGAGLAALGQGGYDLGARAQQIRDALRAREQFDEAGLHALQLDHRALFLQRWRALLLERVLTPEFVARAGLADYRAEVERSADAARPDAVGYRLVHDFRERVLRQLFAPLAGLLEAQGLKLHDLKFAPETPAWALIEAARPDTLPDTTAADGAGPIKTWPQLLQQAVLSSRDALIREHGSLAAATWGAANPTRMAHPLSRALPPLSRWLDMPARGMAGDSHMPRVHHQGHGQSERMVVSPGHEASGILVIAGGQSGHPLSPFYRSDHAAWLAAEPLPFLPGPPAHRLELKP